NVNDGLNGSKGADGNGIASSVVAYQAGTSATVAPTGVGQVQFRQYQQVNFYGYEPFLLILTRQLRQSITYQDR
ncbi:hypothetical protein, partial [Streptococcus uberis]|uniref:hypothetical protein n=1 Tax=Streptococcus uberis TaxID=1349 RepID=UPI001FF0FCAC